MKIPLLHQQILLQTEKLRELHRNIMMHAPPVPVSDIDGLLHELRLLYSTVLELNNENALQLLNEVQIAVNHKSVLDTNPHFPEQVKNSMHIQKEQIEETGFSTSNKPVNGFTAETFSKTASNFDVHDLFKEIPTLAGRFTDHQTLGEKIALNESKKTVSENLKTPVKDIKSIIGLNEKFQFINLLFHGNADKYNAVIDSINTCVTSNEAKNKIIEIEREGNWDHQSQVRKSFLEIIERRFSA